MILVPKGEDEPSSHDEEEAIVAMMPQQWQKCIEVTNTSMTCASKEVSYSMVVALMW